MFVVGAYNAVFAWAIYLLGGRALRTIAIVTRGADSCGIAGPHFIPWQQSRYVAHLVQTDFPQSESYPSDWLDVHAAS